MLFKVQYNKEVHVTNKQISNYDALLSFITEVFSKIPKEFCLTYKDEDDDMVCLVNEKDFQIMLESGMNKVRIEIKKKDEQIEKVTANGETPGNETGGKIEIIEKMENMVKEEKLEGNLEEEEKIEVKKNDDFGSSEIEIQNEAKIMNFEEKYEKKEESNSLEFLNELNECELAIHYNFTCKECKVSPIIGILYKCVICTTETYDLCSNCEEKTLHKHPFLKIKSPDQIPEHLFAVIDDKNCVEEKEEGEKKEIKKNYLFDNVIVEKSQKVFGFLTKLHWSRKGKTEQNTNIKEESIAVNLDETNIERKVSDEQESKKRDLLNYLNRIDNKKDEEKEWKIECTNYLCNILNINFNEAFEFVEKTTKNEKLSANEILNKYLKK